MDAGCGTGRLAAGLLERLPRGRVMAVDRSQNMLEEARTHLARQCCKDYFEARKLSSTFR
jgi:trans-aconitate methyltransferase